MKTMQQKLDLISAVYLVADFWEVEPTELIAFVALTKKDKTEKWNKIAKEVSEFSKMDIVERGKKLGLKIKIEHK
jgi:ribosomal protein L32E